MSAETLEKAIEKKPAEALLSKRRKKLVTDPLVDDNPITVQVLGICSSLADYPAAAYLGYGYFGDLCSGSFQLCDLFDEKHHTFPREDHRAASCSCYPGYGRE